MKKLIITTVCCLLAQLFMPVNAQTWDITIDDDGEGECIKTYDGGYVVGGVRLDGMINYSKVYRIDGDGNIVYYFNGDGDLEAEKGIVSIVKTYDSNYIAVNHGNYFKLVKLDNNLNHIWTKTYGGGAFSDYSHISKCIQRTYDSNYIVIGSYMCDNDYDDLFLIKINNAGDTLWTKKYGELTVDERGEYIIPTYDNGFICAAYLWEQSYIWMLKLNKNGDTLWTKWTKTSTNYEHVSALIQLNDSSYIVGTNHSIMNINKHGSILWDSSYNFYINAVKKFADGGYIAVGNRGYDGSETVKMVRLDENGGVLWAKSPQNLSYSPRIANDVVINDDQGFTITGSNSYGFWVAKLDSMGNGLDTTTTDINKTPTKAFQNKVKIHPNPFKDKVTIEINDKRNVINAKVIILNSEGMVIMQKQIKNDLLFSLDTSGLPSGTYTCKIEINRQLFTKKLIKQ